MVTYDAAAAFIPVTYDLIWKCLHSVSERRPTKHRSHQVQGHGLPRLLNALEQVTEELPAENVISHSQFRTAAPPTWKRKARQEQGWVHQAKKPQAASLAALTPCISLKNFSLNDGFCKFFRFQLREEKHNIIK